jgi:uncharacterized protein YeaO (DUF488 family)
MDIRLKRAYDTPVPSDGRRILVERLWPRGLSKERVAVDLWLKDVAPSSELRRWFGHDPGRWEEFRRRYHEELRRRPEGLARLSAYVAQGPVTLVYGSREREHNSAAALKAFLEGEGARGRKGDAG